MIKTHKGPLMQRFDVFYAAILKKKLNKQSSWWCFEAP